MIAPHDVTSWGQSELTKNQHPQNGSQSLTYPRVAWAPRCTCFSLWSCRHPYLQSHNIPSSEFTSQEDQTIRKREGKGVQILRQLFSTAFCKLSGQNIFLDSTGQRLGPGDPKPTSSGRHSSNWTAWTRRHLDHAQCQRRGLSQSEHGFEILNWKIVLDHSSWRQQTGLCAPASRCRHCLDFHTLGKNLNIESILLCAYTLHTAGLPPSCAQRWRFLQLVGCALQVPFRLYSLFSCFEWAPVRALAIEQVIQCHQKWKSCLYKFRIIVRSPFGAKHPVVVQYRHRHRHIPVPVPTLSPSPIFVPLPLVYPCWGGGG